MSEENPTLAELLEQEGLDRETLFNTNDTTATASRRDSVGSVSSDK